MLHVNLVREPLQTGIKAIDALFPIGKGQRELVIVIDKQEKLQFVIDTILNQRENFYNSVSGAETVYCIYV